jgi:hypothetical protein
MSSGLPSASAVALIVVVDPTSTLDSSLRSSSAAAGVGLHEPRAQATPAQFAKRFARPPIGASTRSSTVVS